MYQDGPDPFQTWRQRAPEQGDVPAHPRRMRVTAINAGGNANLVTAVLYDGATAGTRTYTVFARGKAVNDEIMVTRPTGGVVRPPGVATAPMINGQPVVLQEIAGGVWDATVGEFQHMVFQAVSQNQTGFEFVQAHALP